jgi:hypothetical protein
MNKRSVTITDTVNYMRFPVDMIKLNQRFFQVMKAYYVDINTEISVFSLTIVVLSPTRLWIAGT